MKDSSICPEAPIRRRLLRLIAAGLTLLVSLNIARAIDPDLLDGAAARDRGQRQLVGDERVFDRERGGEEAFAGIAVRVRDRDPRFIARLPARIVQAPHKVDVLADVQPRSSVAVTLRQKVPLEEEAKTG